MGETQSKKRGVPEKIWNLISLCLTVIGSISIVEDTNAWKNLISSALLFLSKNSYIFYHLVDLLSNHIHFIVYKYRLIVHAPLSDILNSFGIEFNSEIFDLLLICTGAYWNYIRFNIIRLYNIVMPLHYQWNYLRDLGIPFFERANLQNFYLYEKRRFYNFRQKFAYERKIRILKKYNIDPVELTKKLDESRLHLTDLDKLISSYRLSYMTTNIVLLISLLFVLVDMVHRA